MKAYHQKFQHMCTKPLFIAIRSQLPKEDFFFFLINLYCILHVFTRKFGYEDYLTPSNSPTKRCSPHHLTGICTGLHSQTQGLRMTCYVKGIFLKGEISG